MGFFDGPGPRDIDNWVCIFERGTEYEVAMVKNYLSNLKIPSNILSKRDSSYNLNIGETSNVYLYVPLEFEARARKALQELEESEWQDFDWDEQSWDDESGEGGEDDENGGNAGGAGGRGQEGRGPKGEDTAADNEDGERS